MVDKLWVAATVAQDSSEVLPVEVASKQQGAFVLPLDEMEESSPLKVQETINCDTYHLPTEGSWVTLVGS